MAALTCALTILSWRPDSRSLASSKESPRVPGANGPRSTPNTSWVTVGASSSASIPDHHGELHAARSSGTKS